jgi:AraC-like DNA-binding protein
MHVHPGDVILHGAYESHLDQVNRIGAEVLVLPWRGAVSMPLGSVRDPDAIARLVERDVRAAAAQLESELVLRPAETLDWPDRLATDLRRDPGLALDRWAIGAGLRPESVSRGFRRAYGITPAAFRARSRTLHALAQLTSGRSLAEVAIDCGFADQAHFTRSFRLLTGTSPSRWARLTD